MYRRTPAVNRNVLTVETVDQTLRLVHGKDKTNSWIRASYVFTDTATQIPQQGEVWTIMRHGTFWHLDQRVDSVAEAATKGTLNPGDVHLRTPNTLHIDAKLVALPGGGLGATVRDTFVGNGSKTAFTLSHTPINADTVMAFSNTAYLHETDDWTLSTNVITLVVAPAGGVHLAVHYQT